MRIGIPGTLPKSPSLRRLWVTGYFLIRKTVVNDGFEPRFTVAFCWHWRRVKYGVLLYPGRGWRDARWAVRARERAAQE